jgi:UDP-N-acetylglucosamine--N-acetylmuramyl-(pentapeptide) pyrophosphoryl-undecaprenol N-acetylglucosamine transferase
MALVDQDAALLVEDNNAESELIENVKSLLLDENKRKEMTSAIAKFARPDATKQIVDIVEKILS